MKAGNVVILLKERLSFVRSYKKDRQGQDREGGEEPEVDLEIREVGGCEMLKLG